MPRGRKPKQQPQQPSQPQDIQQNALLQQGLLSQQVGLNRPSQPVPPFPTSAGVKRRFEEIESDNDNNDEYDDGGSSSSGGGGGGGDGTGERRGKNRRLSANTIVVKRLMEAADQVDAMDELEEMAMRNNANGQHPPNGKYEDEEEGNDNDGSYLSNMRRLQVLAGISPSSSSSFSSTTASLPHNNMQLSQPPPIISSSSQQVSLHAPITSTYTHLAKDSVGFNVIQQSQMQMQQQQQQLTKKSDVSLTKLAQRFIGYMKSRPELTVDLNEVASALKTSKRRIYDITNVLEGTDFLCKVSKSVVRWKEGGGSSDGSGTASSAPADKPQDGDHGSSSSSSTAEVGSGRDKDKDCVSEKLAAEAKADGFPQERLTRQCLVEDIERAREKVAALDARLAAVKEEKAALTSDPATRDLLYVTVEDLESVRMLQDSAFVVVCSPYGSRLEVVCEMQNDVFVSTPTGSISMATFNFRNETDYDDSSDSDSGDGSISDQYGGGINQKSDDFYSRKYQRPHFSDTILLFLFVL